MAEKEEIYRLLNGETIYKKVCLILPILVNSNSTTLTSLNKQLDSTLPSMEFQFILIIFLNIIFHFLFKRLPFSKLVTFIIAGISFAGIKWLFDIAEYQSIISRGGEETLGTFTLLGYMMFLFTIGVKMDMKMIITTGRKALAVGVVALIAPLISVAVFVGVVARNDNIDKGDNLTHKLVSVGVTHSLSTFPVISYLLHELEIINSELGRLALSSAVISELLSMFILTTAATFAMQQNNTNNDPSTLSIEHIVKILLLVVFLVCAVFIVRPTMFWIIRRTPEGRPVKDGYIMIIIIGVLLASIASDWFGQFVLFAPYILGLAMPDGPPLGSALVDKLETFISGMLVPVFITSCASNVVYVGIKDVIEPQIYLSICLVIITFGVKLIACLITTKWGFKMPWNDGLALSFIMSAKGIVEMATYSVLADSQHITRKCFTIVLFAIMISAGITPVLVKRLYDPSKKYAGYKKRNIANLRSNEELRVLLCIHRADNIDSCIKLLDVSSPTKETPILVSVLHLIELVGRTTPIFISHQYQRIISEHSYSKNVIMAFDEYQRIKGSDTVSVQMFTAVSPPKLMHEDIGTLALNKLTSLIVMPFHRKWSLDGTVESENHSIRALNCSVLDRAPCSVGIFIDRTRLISIHSPSMYRIAMIFIGGDDDREAFAYTKRMAKGSSLTVIKVIDNNAEGDKQWDWMMDSEVLKEVKMRRLEGVRNVDYREEMVVDGTETAMKIRGIVKNDDFDLIVVGRRYELECIQTSGLMEWTEFPELGVLGDLLASTDLESRSSVLVVQSQRIAVK